MIDSLEVGGDRGGPEVRAGQVRRQLDQHEGRRGGVRAAREARAPLRRGGDRHGVRREGPGRHARAQDRDLRARATTSSSTRSASRPRTSSSIRTSSRSRPASRSTTTTASTSSRRRAGSARTCRTRKVSRRGVEHLVLVPRQRPGARGDPHRVPVPRDQGRDDDGRSSTPGQLGVYDEIPKDLLEHVEDVIFNRRPDATERLVTFAETLQGRRRRTRREDLAWRKGTRGGAPHARAGARASPTYIVEDTEEARAEVRAARSR